MLAEPSLTTVMTFIHHQKPARVLQLGRNIHLGHITAATTVTTTALNNVAGGSGINALAVASNIISRGGAAAAGTGTAIMDPVVKASAMSFFTGVRIPAALIAGSSLAALFTLTSKSRDTSGLSTTEILLLRLYHVFSLISFCLSMTAVVMSTSAGTMLLLHDYQIPPNNARMDLYHFLREYMDLEFTLTRFSFLTSLICFLSAVTGRIIIEFDLWTEKRRLAGFMVLSKMTAVLTLLLSYANTTLKCWDNLLSMGWHVAKLLWERATVAKHPLQIVSMISFGIAALCALIFFLPSSAENDKLRDRDSYI